MYRTVRPSSFVVKKIKKAPCLGPCMPLIIRTLRGRIFGKLRVKLRSINTLKNTCKTRFF